MGERRIEINSKLLLAVLFAALIFASAAIFETEKESAVEFVRVKINNTAVEAELADTPEKRAAGLSGRAELNENQGMLFVFENADRHSFWMKNMKFPIDIIWTDENKKIVHIAKNISPESYPQTFAPPTPAKYALEVSAGFADKHSIKNGQIADIMTIKI